MRPLAQQRARLARVDDVEDAELLGRAEGRADAVVARLQRRAQRLGVGCSLDLGLVRSLDPALDRDRAPARRGPGKAVVQGREVLRRVHAAGHAEGAPHDDAQPGDAHVLDRGDHAHRAQQRAGELSLQAGGVAGLVHQVDHGQAEGVAQLRMALGLVGRGHRHRAAGDLGVAAQHAHGPAVQPRQRRDDRAALVAPDLEHRVAVEQRREDAARVVDLAPVARDRVLQPVIGARRVVAGHGARGQRVRARGQVAQEAAHLGQGIGLVDGLVVHERALAVHLVAAQVVLVDVDAVGLLDHRRPGREDLGLVTHHDREVRQQHLDRAQAGAGAQRHADHRHGLQQFHPGPGGIARDLGRGHLLQQLDAAAGGVDQAHQRHLLGQRHALGVDPLVGVRALGRAGAQRVVVGRDDDAAAVDAAAADDGVDGLQVEQAALGVVAAAAGDATDLAEAAAVQQGGDALARRLPPARLVACHRLLAAHARGQAPPQLQLGQLLGPLAGGFELRGGHAHFAARPSSVASSVVAFHSASK